MYHLFWGGHLSQWSRHSFTIGQDTYNCAEQYMMAMKARTFDDKIALDCIMASKDPAFQKAMGKKVKNFDPNIWSAVSMDIVLRGSLAKFTQNYDALSYLLAIREEIVEASPYDIIWGIGLGENDPDAQDKTKWRGENKLGIVLMEVRDSIWKTRRATTQK
mgnify:FL=1|tara:strand:- start:937 stop:1419 length:483 start_codon:yes stop_codon:yes gene_type:complete